MAPGQARTGPGSRVRLSGHDTTHETRTYVQTWTRRPQEGKKNVAVMAKELKNNFVIKGFLALFNMVAPPAEKKEENRF